MIQPYVSDCVGKFDSELSGIVPFTIGEKEWHSYWSLEPSNLTSVWVAVKSFVFALP